MRSHLLFLSALAARALSAPLSSLNAPTDEVTKSVDGVNGNLYWKREGEASSDRNLYWKREEDSSSDDSDPYWKREEAGSEGNLYWRRSSASKV